MVIAQGDVCWADLPDPVGSGPGFRRPVLVVQGDAFNRSRVATVVCVPLTSNLKWAEAPGNVELPAKSTGLSKDSVANVSQIVSLGRPSGCLPVQTGTETRPESRSIRSSGVDSPNAGTSHPD